MKLVSILILIVLPLSVFGQDSLSYEWKEVGKYGIKAEGIWSADGLENVFVSQKTVLNKYDSIGDLKFSQSIKSLGQSTQFLPINTMKLVNFSEDQQTLCFFDNTLTRSEDCLELADRDIVYASMIASSERSDKLWVYDNINSNLHLIDLEGNKLQELQISNLKGVLGLNDICQIKERFNRLFVVDSLKGVYIFDMYGSLTDKIDMKGAVCVDANESTAFILTADELISHGLKTAFEAKIELPRPSISEFILENRSFFLRTEKNVYKYQLQISK